MDQQQHYCHRIMRASVLQLVYALSSVYSYSSNVLEHFDLIMRACQHYSTPPQDQQKDA